MDPAPHQVDELRRADSTWPGVRDELHRRPWDRDAISSSAKKWYRIDAIPAAHHLSPSATRPPEIASASGSPAWSRSSSRASLGLPCSTTSFPRTGEATPPRGPPRSRTPSCA
ncbi:uncharacterized protein A4U43_C08F35670 [Asparagus officinalis]|nr:uncharacterized protein A4U43_C08F35670 [Asparagus officinalis]